MQLPVELLQSLQGIQGFSKDSFVKVHESGEQVTSVRLNPGKKNMAADSAAVNTVPAELGKQALLSPVPWCSTGYYLSQRPSFTLDPVFHAGAYYVQEASSMFLEQAVKKVLPLHNSGVYRVLDLCAAPGGKSTHLSSLFPKGLVVCNEVIKARAGILTENIIKWGNENVVVTNNDASDFKRLPGFFDLIVVDAPCSGSGMFRKDAEAIGEWSLQHVDHCAKRQRRILEDIWPCLKENGWLIYSTCSYSKEENEDMLDWMNGKFDMESKSIMEEEQWGIIETRSGSGCPAYRFYPDRVKGEGLFMACVEKLGTAPAEPGKGKKLLNLDRHGQKVLEDWIADAANYDYVLLEGEILAFDRNWRNDISVLMQVLYVKKAGIRVGKMIRDELIPDHELLLSRLISSNLNQFTVDLDTALQYLRKQEIKGNVAVKGWAAVVYHGFCLGWIKALPNRINNYYPQRFRILKH
ncbi:MAG: RNA methyltransferase [Chitinophagaceae bacterium]|nr:RNA methyltransferase [Chitinophagaceae bacterium]